MLNKRQIQTYFTNNNLLQQTHYNALLNIQSHFSLYSGQIYIKANQIKT